MVREVGVPRHISQYQKGLMSISCKSTMAGSLREVHHQWTRQKPFSSSINFLADGCDLSNRLESSPTHVLQTNSLRSVSSGVWSSPRADNHNSPENKGGLCDDILKTPSANISIEKQWVDNELIDRQTLASHRYNSPLIEGLQQTLGMVSLKIGYSTKHACFWRHYKLKRTLLSFHTKPMPVYNQTRCCFYYSLKELGYFVCINLPKHLKMSTLFKYIICSLVGSFAFWYPDILKVASIILLIGTCMLTLFKMW